MLSIYLHLLSLEFSGKASALRATDIETREVCTSFAGVRLLSPADDVFAPTTNEDFAILQKMQRFDLESNGNGARDPNNIGAHIIPVGEAVAVNAPVATALAVDTATLLPEDSIAMAYPVAEEWVSAVPVSWTVSHARDHGAKMREEALKRRLITPLEARVMKAAALGQNDLFETHNRVLESRMSRAVKSQKKRSKYLLEYKDTECLASVIADAMRYNILTELVRLSGRIVRAFGRIVRGSRSINLYDFRRVCGYVAARIQTFNMISMSSVTHTHTRTHTPETRYRTPASC